MFQVVPEPEFAAWFESLPEPLAEEVATAVDLAANVGSLIAPERLSRLLLWFDGTAPGGGTELDVPGLQYASQYLMWHQEVRLCLESAVFRQRLEHLDPKAAAQALSQVERLRHRLHWTRLASNVTPWAYSAAPTDASGLRAAFLELLGLLGLEPQVVLGSGSGLRELCIDNVQPQLRVLFGLDFSAKRLLAISGEPLSRRYYGDSVKHAEQRWQQYCIESSTTRNATP